MSVRTRGSMESNIIFDYSYGGVSQNDTRSYTSVVPLPLEGYEFLSDEKPQFKRYGNCYHRLHTAVSNGMLEYKGDGDDYFVSDRACWVTLEQANAQRLSPDEWNWEDFSARAMKSMKPTLSQGLSLSNFLYELKEFKDMFKLWRKGKTFAQNVASGHLNYSFGWKPFLADCKKIYDGLQNRKELLLKYKSQQGQPLIRHYKETQDEFVLISLLDGDRRTIRTTRDIELRATVLYTYTIPRIDREYSELGAILDILGLKMTAAVIWQAIPFSFVVDWFLNVGQFLEQFDYDNLDSKVTILDFCYSLKATEFREYLRAPDPMFGNPEVTLAEETVSHYCRRRCIPRDDAIFGIKNSEKFGTKQIVLSAAMLHA